MANSDVFLAATVEERQRAIDKLVADPDRVTALIAELNDQPDLASDLARDVADLGIGDDIDLILAHGRIDLAHGRIRVNNAVLLAYAMEKEANQASPVSVMIREAECVQKALVDVSEHPDVERHLAEALRQLDVSEELSKDLARSNAAALETIVASLLPLQIDSAKGVVAAGETPKLANRSRRGFLGSVFAIVATGVVTYGISKHDTDRQIASSTEDTDRIVEALEGTVADQAKTIEHLGAALEAALKALEAACQEPAV